MPAVNLGARFVLELLMLGALGYWGFTSSDAWLLRILLGLGAPLTALVLWGMFVAPRGSRLLADPPRLGLEVLLFGAASAALLAAGRPGWAVTLAVAVAVNISLMFIFGQR